MIAAWQSIFERWYQTKMTDYLFLYRTQISRFIALIGRVNTSEWEEAVPSISSSYSIAFPKILSQIEYYSLLTLEFGFLHLEK